MNEAMWKDVAAPPEKLWAMPTWLVGHVAADARRAVDEAFGNTSGKTDFAILAGLDQYAPIGQAGLGRLLGINLGDLVAILKRLEAQGLMSRSPDPDDRRRNVISITDDGRAELYRLEAAARSAQDELLEPLSTAQRAQLVELLQAVVEHHRDYRR